MEFAVISLPRKDWLDYDFMRIYGDLKVALKNLFIAQVLLEYQELITMAKKKTNEKRGVLVEADSKHRELYHERGNEGVGSGKQICRCARCILISASSICPFLFWITKASQDWVKGLKWLKRWQKQMRHR